MKYEYCPNWNTWKDISWIFDRVTYMYCECNKCKKAIYELRPINITKKFTKETFHKLDREKRIEKLKTKLCSINDIWLIELEELFRKKL